MLEAEGGMGTGAPLATGAESITIAHYKVKTELPTTSDRRERGTNTQAFLCSRAYTTARFRLITPQSTRRAA